MSKIEIKTNITAPPEINIPLVRADHSGTANIFRVFFEIFLSIFSTFLGYILNQDKPRGIDYIFLGTLLIAVIAFLWLSHSYSKKAHYG